MMDSECFLNDQKTIRQVYKMDYERKSSPRANVALVNEVFIIMQSECLSQWFPRYEESIASITPVDNNGADF